MRQKIFLITSLIAFSFVNAASAASISKYYYEKITGNKIRIVFEITGGDTKISYVTNQNQLHIDLDKTSWKPASNVTLPGAFVKDFTYENPSHGNLRITLFLADNIRTAKPAIRSAIGSSKIEILLEKQSDLKPEVEIITGRKESTKQELTKNNSENNLPLSMRQEYKAKNPWDFPSFTPPEWKGYGDKSILKKDDSLEENAPVERTKANPVYKPVVILDPGHGGRDSGAISRSKVKEKKITLEYARILQEKLEASGKYKVYLTRTGDRYITLDGRVKKARGYNGDLFISIHADSHPDPNTRGLSVYTLSERRAKYEAAKLSEKADNENVLRGIDLKNELGDVRDVLIDLAQRNTKNSSAIFAEMLVNELGSDVKLLDRTHRFAGFAVLTGVDIPSVLVELGYLTNKTEEKLLLTREYREKLTTGMKDAIDKYFVKYNAAHEK